MPAQVDHLGYYRLPWSYSDNAISWLEPTSKCNLRCEGCYRETEEGSHKTLEEVQSDLEVFQKNRKSDCISIAGGDPLVHPDILKIIKMIKTMGWKPIINTNGIALTKELLQELKDAGTSGFTFHIDTTQKRPSYHGATETDLNEERLRYANMLNEVGGMTCSFNATISRKTIDTIPALVRWAQNHADVVHNLVFILYRSPRLSGDVDFFVEDQKIEFGKTYKESDWGGGNILHSPDIIQKIREADPMYEPAAYLNGTGNPQSLKWLLAARVVYDGQVMGYVSPKFIELAQTLNHMFTGRYLSYTTPKALTRARLWAMLCGIWDRKLRSIAGRIIKRTLTNPGRLFHRAHLQSFMIIQPVDIGMDGRQDMCDGCPDITVHNGQLVWSCRLEELNKFGYFVSSYPKDRAKNPHHNTTAKSH